MKNPKFHITVSEPGAEAFVSFYQNSNRGIYALQHDQKVLGWHIVQNSRDLKRPSKDIIGSAVPWSAMGDGSAADPSNSTEGMVAQSQPRYTRNRFVSMSVTFATSGKYLLVPSTWNEGDQASFLISIMSRGGIVATDAKGNLLPMVATELGLEGGALGVEEHEKRERGPPLSTTTADDRKVGKIAAVTTEGDGEEEKGDQVDQDEDGASSNAAARSKDEPALLRPGDFERAKERFLREVKICKLTPRHASALFAEGSAGGAVSKKAFKQIMLTAGATISSFPDNFFRNLSQGDPHSIALALVEEILHCEEEEQDILDATRRLDELAKEDDLEYAPTELCGKITLRILEARALKGTEGSTLAGEKVLGSATRQLATPGTEEPAARQKVFVEAVPLTVAESGKDKNKELEKTSDCRFL